MINVKNEVLIRVYIVLLGVIFLAAFIFFAAFKINVSDGKMWREKGDDLYVKFKDIEAQRGNILAEDGSLLATSLPFFEIRMDLVTCTDEDFDANVDSLAYCLATFVDSEHTVGGYRNKLIEKREQGQRYLLIRKNVDFELMQKIKKFPLFNLGRHRGGLIVEQHAERKRPYGLLAHRTIGYVRETAKPVGLEGYFDKQLAGTQGKQLMQRVKNIYIPVNDLSEIQPKNGADLQTTIDINLQDVTQDALYKAVDRHNAAGGTAILMEVKTGAIRAIANLGRTEEGKIWERYNHAIGSLIEPGSTFKLATMMALLEDQVISLNDSIDLEGGSKMFYKEEMKDAFYHNMRLTSIRNAFELSSNVGIAKLAQTFYGPKNRAKRFYKRLQDMNLDVPTGIEIQGELHPRIKNPENQNNNWSGVTIPWMSIGYEVLLTPLQILNFYNSVANDGQMMKPYVVSSLQSNGSIITEFKPRVVKKSIASPHTIKAAQSLLEGVVDRGTAKSLQSERFRFAGKTGTAQVDYAKENVATTYNASFAGYFPAEAPKYSCIVVVNEPKENGIYGGEVAGPVFKEIAEKCYSLKMELHPSLNEAPPMALEDYELPVHEVGAREDFVSIYNYLDLPYANNPNTDWTVSQAQNDTISLLTRVINDKNEVPNVKGMGLRDALFILENKGLHVKVIGNGKVTAQSINPGTRAKGQTIKLKLS